MRRFLPLLLVAGACGSNLKLSQDLNAATTPAALAVDWFQLISTIIQREAITPPPASRIYAYASIALYEGLVHGDPGRQSLAGQLNGLASLPQPTADPHDWMEVANRAIWIVAKSAINESFLPTSTTQPLSRLFIDGVHQSWNERRAVAVPADVYQRSFDYGTTLGNAIVAWAATDGFSSNNNPPYTPPTGPGLWAPTPPLYQRALQPTWGNLRTFVLASADECAPPPPTPFSTVPGSPFYLENLEVYDAVNNLSPEQKEIAIFWSDDPGVTATPPGHWVSIVTLLVQRDALPLGLAAEAYARVGLAVADAFIACWRTKYTYNLVRPTTYIRDHIDGDWLPLLGTPPFPEYTSGHSTQSGAVAVVLTDLLGVVSFVDTTHSARGLPPRAFLSFMQAAQEAAISRLYGGIHYRPAIDNGVDQGVCIGQAIVDRVQFGS